MDFITDIANWVEKKPLALISFDDKNSRSLLHSRRGLTHFTFTRPHEDLKDFKIPTFCLVQLIDRYEVKLFIGVLSNKTAVSTLESRLTLTDLQRIIPNSLEELSSLITNSRFNSYFVDKIPAQNTTAVLSPKLSSNLIEILANYPENTNALNSIVDRIPKIRPIPHERWAQGNAIKTALNAFGIEQSYKPDELYIKTGHASGLSKYGEHVLEDNVLIEDARQLLDFSLDESSITGRAIFRKADEELEVITANRGPLEEMFGVDMLYINERLKSIVMVQYKMLEGGITTQSRDWTFRPREHDFDEIRRMNIPPIDESSTTYRLNENPFFFKFVKRKVVEDSHQSFIMSLEHLKQLLDSPEGQGPRGGLRVSYDTLDGAYLREGDFIGLIRSGYIGTHGTATEMLSPIINEAFTGNKALVLAWQKRIEQVDN